MRILLLISAVILLSSGCKQSQHKRKSELEKTVNYWYKKEISFPDSIYKISNSIIEILKENPLSSNKYKILSVISGECEKCIIDAKEWCVFIDSISDHAKFDFVPVFVTSDYHQFIKSYYKRLPSCFEPYLDVHFKFILNYNLPENWSMRTFLLDKNNRVMIIGNPIHNHNIRKLYLKKLSRDE